jgi:hypothetical protein
MEKLLVSVEGGDGEVRYNIDGGLLSPKRRRKRQEQPITVIESPSLESIIKGHMVEGYLDTSQMHDEDVLETMAGEETQLRVTVYNTYPEKVVMANCAKLQSKDHHATTGIVHMVDRVIQPATLTIAEIIENDSQLGSLAEALRR